MSPISCDYNLKGLTLTIGFSPQERHAGQLILDVTYGIAIASREDFLIKTAEAVMNTISIAVSPAMWIINPIPISK